MCPLSCSGVPALTIECLTVYDSGVYYRLTRRIDCKLEGMFRCTSVMILVKHDPSLQFTSNTKESESTTRTTLSVALLPLFVPCDRQPTLTSRESPSIATIDSASPQSCVFANTALHHGKTWVSLFHRLYFAAR